jgi:hypothetical protein
VDGTVQNPFGGLTSEDCLSSWINPSMREITRFDLSVTSWILNGL